MLTCSYCLGYMPDSAIVRGGRCVGCVREYNRTYYASKRERILEKSKCRRLSDIERARERERAASKIHYSQNREKRQAANKRSCAKSPGMRLHRKRLRDALKVRATPQWADLEMIAEIYAIARLVGYHVDHIIPLKGRLVCGLHVHNNLQLLSPEENLRKSNKFEV